MRMIDRRFMGVFICLLFLTPIVWAGGNRQALFQEAGQAYSSGDYVGAIEKYETLRADGGSAALFYNLANSYAQSGQSGRAILNYERALRLEPGDSDARGNLELLRREKGLFQTEKSLQQQFVSFLGMNQWTGLAAAGFVLFLVVLLLPVTSTMKRASRYLLAGVFLLLTCAAGFGIYGQYQHWHEGVVVTPDARLRVSPFSSAASIGTIQEGRLVHPGKKHGDFSLVMDETGRSGWLEADAFESICGE